MFDNKRSSTRRIAAIAGSAVLAGLALGGTAQAMPDDHPGYDRYCTADQVDVGITPLDHGMMQAGADVQFTAKPGQSCQLGGAPGLTFLDGQGKPLGVSTERAGGDAADHVVDGQHPVNASFHYQVTDPNTGDALPGPTPASVEVAFPGPVAPYTVNVPWNGTAVPGPVSITNVTPAQG